MTSTITTDIAAQGTTNAAILASLDEADRPAAITQMWAYRSLTAQQAERTARQAAERTAYLMVAQQAERAAYLARQAAEQAAAVKRTLQAMSDAGLEITTK